VDLIQNQQSGEMLLGFAHGLGNQTVQRLIHSSRETSNSVASLQRTISVKGGKRYSSLPQGYEAPRFKALAESPSLYLVRTQADADRMLQQNDVPVLAPKKHLIGETHIQSRFTDAVKDWAWGAELLIEAYGDNKRLTDSAQQDKRNKPTGSEEEQLMWRKAKALEDHSAKALTNLVNARIFISNLLRMADAFTRTSSAFASQDKDALKDLCSSVWQKCNPALTVTLELARYVRESTAERGWGILGSYFPEHEVVQKAVTVELIEGIGKGLDNIKDQIDHPDECRLSPERLRAMSIRIEILIPVLQRLVVAQDPSGFSLGELQEATRLSVEQNSIDPLNSVRERYMRQRIAAAGLPTLVKIGSAHVSNLRDGLPEHALAFDSYDQFEAANTAERVEV
jgi:hypothetical protein